MRLRYALIAFALICLVAFSDAVIAEEIHGTDAAGRDYWVYVPDTIDPEKTYTLVLGVHGYRGNGRGAGGVANWANEHDCIVLGPTYDSNGYQYLEAGSAAQTLNLISMLRNDFTLHEKIFVTGFSGGSQFAHRFAMAYPEIVAGCAAHSGGTWGTGDYDRAVTNPQARSVLFVISCGERDTGKSFGDAPIGRLAWAQRYAVMLQEGGFTYDAQWWPGVGHSYSRGARAMTMDCFVASTQLLPQLRAEADEIDAALRQRDHGQAWALIRQRQEEAQAYLEAQENEQNIIAQVYAGYLGSLPAQIRTIDRLAEREARMVVRDQDDPVQLREALTSMQATYTGLPVTSRVIQESLGRLAE